MLVPGGLHASVVLPLEDKPSPVLSSAAVAVARDCRPGQIGGKAEKIRRRRRRRIQAWGKQPRPLSEVGWGSGAEKLPYKTKAMSSYAAALALSNPCRKPTV